MIAVVGPVAGVQGDLGDGRAAVAGLAGEVAVGAAARGARVELVAKLGDDSFGDAVLLALTRAGVGHAAVLRDPSRPTPVLPGRSEPAGEIEPGEDGPGTLLTVPADEPGTSFVDAPGGLGLATGDLELALRYLADATVIVLADPNPALLSVAVDAAAFAAAALIVVASADALPTEAAAPGATVLAVPPSDSGAAFPTLVAEYAIGLDAGRDAGAAWEAATRRLGAEPA